MKKTHNKKMEHRMRRHAKVRTRVFGSASCPRLSVYRSNKHIYAQIIDDTTGGTLASASDTRGAGGNGNKKNKTEQAKMVGVALAKAARARKIEKVVFDRGGFLYAGRVKALAESAREGGLVF